MFVVPELDMVVVFVSDLDDNDFYIPQELLAAYILPSARSPEPLPANHAGAELLRTRLEALAAP